MKKYRVIERGDGSFMLQSRYWHTLWRDVAYYTHLESALITLEGRRQEQKADYKREKLQKQIVRIYD